MSYCVRWLFWGHLFLAWNASVNPVPAQAIADTRKSVADRLQLGFVTSREKLASVITALPTLSVRVTRYAVDTDAFQATIASVAPACCSRDVVSMNHAVMMCVFKGKIVVVKAVLMTMTALVVKFAVVRSVKMARNAIWTSSYLLPQHVHLLSLLLS